MKSRLTKEELTRTSPKSRTITNINETLNKTRELTKVEIAMLGTKDYPYADTMTD